MSKKSLALAFYTQHLQTCTPASRKQIVNQLIMLSTWGGRRLLGLFRAILLALHQITTWKVHNNKVAIDSNQFASGRLPRINVPVWHSCFAPVHCRAWPGVDYLNHASYNKRQHALAAELMSSTYYVDSRKIANGKYCAYWILRGPLLRIYRSALLHDQ